MSIKTEIDRISGNIDAAFSALEARGTTVPAGSNSDDLADLISAGGSSGSSENAVQLEPENTFDIGDDLNNFTECGNWLCTNSMVASSLANCPENSGDFQPGYGGFQLRVLTTANSLRAQELITFSGKRWYRFYNGSEWSAWAKDYSENDIIAIDNGGTGADNAADARANLDVPATLHYHDAEEITTGVLPIERGGTGASNDLDALANLGGCSLLDCYPVGSIYFGYSQDSPAALFGGEWTRISGRFLFGATASETIGDTGGAKTVKLTLSQIPSHTHVVKGTSATKSGSTTCAETWADKSNNRNVTSNAAGGSSSHENMPPYMLVSIWRRTA